eukprot:jgi/Galph1/4000/GphlegSOOS_G2686.1
MLEEIPLSIGIIRETRSHWERRTPLIPSHVVKLVEQGIRVYVQPSKLRIFSDDSYREAGAIVTEDISCCVTILGVKQVSVHALVPHRTFCMFSHTIKAQPENMPLLDAVLEKKVRLIDYEAIVQVADNTSQGRLPGRRLVAFGRFAGLAGTVTFLRGLGERLLSWRYNTAFLNMGSAYMYPDLESVKEAVRKVGRVIEKEGLPTELCPFIFAITGTGRVSQGVQEILKLLPHEKIEVNDLPHLSSQSVNKENMRYKIFFVVVSTEHMVTPVDPSASFSKADYYENPSRYRPVFHEKVAPFVSVIIHGSYWDRSFCRLLTDDQLQNITMEQMAHKRRRLIGICDITCDYEGAIQSLRQFTSIERPFYIYDPVSRECLDDLTSLPDRGILFHATDNLPAELPKESSEHFSNSLFKFLPSLAASHYRDHSLSLEYEDLPVELQRACIAANGRLTPHFSYIARLREIHDKQPNETQRFHRQVLLKGHLFDSRAINDALDVIEAESCSFEIIHWTIGQTRNMPSTLLLRLDASSDEHAEFVVKKLEQVTGSSRVETSIEEEPNARRALEVKNVYVMPHGNESKVLLLGSGRVAGPLVDYLVDKEGYELTIASNEPDAAKALAKNREKIRTLYFEIENNVLLKDLVEHHHIIVSLLPSPFHGRVARACIEVGERHLVTASYVSPEMQQLDEEAKEKHVILVNEVGLDPGIDHMLAHQLIGKVRQENGHVVSFHSWCGGLPAPSCATSNPFLYKFSWSPRGMLVASQASAKFQENGKQVNVEGEYLMTSARPVDISTFPEISLPLEVLPNRDSLQYIIEYNIPEAETVLRGTLRYAGFSRIMDACVALGLLKEEKNDWLTRLLSEKKDNQRLREEALERIRNHWGEGLQLCGSKNREYDRKEEEKALQGIEWLGLFDGELRQYLSEEKSPVDALSKVLEKNLALREDEQDAVVMIVRVQYRVGDDLRQLQATLTELGDAQWNKKPYAYTAMARTVGITCAMAVKLIKEQKISKCGVIRPSPKELSEPILKWIKEQGIQIKYSQS